MQPRNLSPASRRQVPLNVQCLKDFYPPPMYIVFADTANEVTHTPPKAHKLAMHDASCRSPVMPIREGALSSRVWSWNHCHADEGVASFAGTIRRASVGVLYSVSPRNSRLDLPHKFGRLIHIRRIAISLNDFPPTSGVLLHASSLSDSGHFMNFRVLPYHSAARLVRPCSTLIGGRSSFVIRAEWLHNSRRPRRLN